MECPQFRLCHVCLMYCIEFTMQLHHSSHESLLRQQTCGEASMFRSSDTAPRQHRPPIKPYTMPLATQPIRPAHVPAPYCQQGSLLCVAHLLYANNTALCQLEAHQAGPHLQGHNMDAPAMQ